VEEFLKYSRSSDNNGYQVLNIEADWSELVADFDDIVSGYEKVRLPGFRPGKVPRSVIEKKFKKEIIDDLSQRAIQRLGLQALCEAGIETLGPMEAQEIECEKDEPFRFQVRFHPIPEITLPALNDINIDHESTDPRDLISIKLLELIPFEIPDDLVRDELAFEGIAASEPGSKDWKAASDRIRLMLILKKIARHEGIEVDERDVINRIAEKAEEFGTSIKELQTELVRGGGLDRLRDMLLAESTIDYLMEINQ